MYMCVVKRLRGKEKIDFVLNSWSYRVGQRFFTRDESYIIIIAKKLIKSLTENAAICIYVPIICLRKDSCGDSRLLLPRVAFSIFSRIYVAFSSFSNKPSCEMAFRA